MKISTSDDPNPRKLNYTGMSDGKNIKCCPPGYVYVLLHGMGLIIIPPAAKGRGEEARAPLNTLLIRTKQSV